MPNDLNKKSINSFVWKSAQLVCSLGITFAIQLILARMLLPEDFGIIAISTVFMTLANTVIETSFSSTVIQRKDLTQNLLSSIFFANFVLSLLVYAVLFFAAPFIASFYKETILIPIIRIQGLRVVVSGLYSIQQALMNRKMRFKALFYCNLIGSICQAVVGLIMAYIGMGIWALVFSTFIGFVITGLLIIVVEPWKLNFYFNFKLVKEALSYSSKILVIRVVRKIFYNIRVLAIGKIYNTEVLGFFNKGFQFPSTAMTVVDGSLTSVSFTHLSKLQNEKEKFIISLRQYVSIAMFLCTPIMVGMALIAKPLVIFLLSDKWLGCVPYLQIICFSQLFVPLNLKTTAFESLGKSGLSMKLHLFGIILSILLLMASAPFSPIIMTLSGVLSNVLLQIPIMVSSKKYLDYSYKSQIKDAVSGFVPTFVMIVAVITLDFFDFKQNYLLELFLKVLCGVISFLVVSIATRNNAFYIVVDVLKIKVLRNNK